MATNRRQKRNTSGGIRKSVRITALLLLLSVLSLSFTGCVKNTELPPNTVRIGILEPMTGEEAEGAKAELRGIMLARNGAESVQGKQIELVYADTRSTLRGAEKAAEELVEMHCIATIGSYGNMMTLAASDTLENAEIPLLNVTGTNRLLSGSSPYLFRTATVETDQASFAASYLTETLNKSHVAILLPSNDDYAASMAEEFANAAEGDCEIVPYVSGSNDFSLPLLALRSSGCEAVFLPGTAEDVGAFLEAATARGAKWTYFGTQRLKTDAFLKNFGAFANGLYMTGEWDPLVSYTDVSSEFLLRHREEYGEDATPMEAEAFGYEAYRLLLDAMERAEELTGPAVQKALSETEAFAGVTGYLTIDEEGDLERTQTVWMVAESRFVNPLTYTPPTQEPFALPGDEE